MNITEALLEIKNTSSDYLHDGICIELESRINTEVHHAIGHLLADQWREKWSGDLDFPIPAPNTSVPTDLTVSETKAEWAFDWLPLWDKTTEYGRSRYEALDVLINYAHYLKICAKGYLVYAPN